MIKDHIQTLPQAVREELQRRHALVDASITEGKRPVAYHNFVGTLFKEMDTPVTSFHHAATGVSGEGGELLDCSKKAWVYGRELNFANAIEEIGDNLFYLVAACKLIGIDLNDAIAWNRVKLDERYPEGVYTDEHANARLDKVNERKFMRDDKPKATSGYMQCPPPPASPLVSPHTDGVFDKPEDGAVTTAKILDGDKPMSAADAVRAGFNNKPKGFA